MASPYTEEEEDFIKNFRKKGNNSWKKELKEQFNEKFPKNLRTEDGLRNKYGDLKKEKKKRLKRKSVNSLNNLAKAKDNTVLQNIEHQRTLSNTQTCFEFQNGDILLDVCDSKL
jgi:hypothetical protein